MYGEINIISTEYKYNLKKVSHKNIYKIVSSIDNYHLDIEYYRTYESLDELVFIDRKTIPATDRGYVEALLNNEGYICLHDDNVHNNEDFVKTR